MDDAHIQQVIPETQLSLPAPVPRLALLAMLVLVGGIGLFTLGQYQYYATTLQNERMATAVLGAQDTAACVPVTTVSKSFKEKNRTVTLFAPDKSYAFPLDSIAACVQFTGCASGTGVACKDVATTVDTACISTYLKNNPEVATSRKVVSGEGASAQVRIQDWTVDTEVLATQIKDAVTKEVSYCDVTGEKDGRTNIGNIQLAVTNAKPGVEEDFATQFVEIDKSRAELYLWNKGSFKTFSIKSGVRLPKEAIYRIENVQFSSFMQSQQDTSYIQKQTQKGEYIVVHD